MIFRRRHKANGQKPDPMFLELQAAREILAEIFHASPRDIADMIQDRLLERNWAAEQTPDESLWPATFCLGD